jgi:hypothetical protein
VVKALLQHGANVEAQDSDGQTCLHKAAVELLKEACPSACVILDNQVLTQKLLFTCRSEVTIKLISSNWLCMTCRKFVVDCPHFGRRGS